MASKFSSGVINNLVSLIEEDIHDGCGLDLSISELSCISGYSIWHLQRTFRMNVGVSLGRYIRNRRLSHAATLIKLSNNKLLDISISTGFNSPQAFCRAFLRQFGVTPSFYKRECTWDFSFHLPAFINNDTFFFSYQKITLSKSQLLLSDSSSLMKVAYPTLDTASMKMKMIFIDGSFELQSGDYILIQLDLSKKNKSESEFLRYLYMHLLPFHQEKIRWTFVFRTQSRESNLLLEYLIPIS
ncbi:helix-turn-helix domain-containing protein [Serratia ureilytica]|uniref:helix-turn-helix domain-containing protein n=1 Tax=Serratia ureilytica TaxID=300181 RepID=UPI0039B3B531